jgi:hypothetical protein
VLAPIKTTRENMYIRQPAAGDLGTLLSKIDFTGYGRNVKYPD